MLILFLSTLLSWLNKLAASFSNPFAQANDEVTCALLNILKIGTSSHSHIPYSTYLRHKGIDHSQSTIPQAVPVNHSGHEIFDRDT